MIGAGRTVGDPGALRVGILGSTQAWTGGGAAVALGGPGRRAALALLALEAGRIVPVQRLVDGLYGEEAPAGVGNALQSQISRLRAALRVPGEPDPIENHPAGYRLALGAEQVDAHRFTRLAAAGRRALDAGDHADAVEQLGAALALWRGPALADVADAPFAAAQRSRLEELRLAATEDRAEARTALGEPREAAADLRELVAAHPLRERPAALLVLALHADGRQAEALAAWSRAREALAEELGADPGPELAAAQLTVLRGPAEPTPRPVAAVAVASGRSSLPVRLSALIGREQELVRIDQALGRGRLLTLTGPGGAGKTRTAVESAARYGGDSCFADLSGLTDGTDLAQTVLSALGLRGSTLLGPAEGPLPLARLTAALTERPLLLVLDNCEHLIADAARLAADLLAACPELRILATSREALAITGEQLLPLPPLPEAAALQLFAERAAAVQPAFDAEREAGTVAEICRRLDGLPLAIELAAARLRSLTPRQVADRLDDRFRLLTGGSRVAQPRQQTLRAVVDWSWDLLPEAERAVLRRASVFAGGWTLEAAEAVCAQGPGDRPEEVLELVASLVDKSLVIARQPASGEPDGVRYRMLQTVRAYAAERLADSGEQQRTRRAHLDHFLALATTAGPYLRTAEQLHWLQLLAADHDNLHAALRGADTGTALRLMDELAGYWLLRGLRHEGGPHARRILDALGPAPVALPAGATEEQYAICVLLGRQGEHGLAEPTGHLAAVAELMEAFQRTPPHNPALTLLWAPVSGVPRKLDELTPEETAQWLDDPWYKGLFHAGRGFWHWYMNADAEAADREFSASVTQYRSLGDRWGTIIALTELASVVHTLGDRDRARELTAEALRSATELGATEDTADVLCGRAERAAQAGELEAAQADAEEAAALFRRTGLRETVPRALLCLATVARLRGDLPAARTQGEAVLAETNAGWFGGDWLLFGARLELARTDQAAGDLAAARARYRQALTPDIDDRNLPALAQAADAVADLVRAEGDPEQAAFLLGLARALRRSEGAPSVDRRRTADAVGAALGAAGYEQARARGAALRPEAAVAALIEVAQRP